MWRDFYFDIKKRFLARTQYSEGRPAASADLSMEMKEKYYRDLEAAHEQYDVFLHDIRHIVIRIENSYNGQQTNVKTVKDYITQIMHKHGIGLESVQTVVRKYGGIMSKIDENGRYCVKIIIPMQTDIKDPA